MQFPNTDEDEGDFTLTTAARSRLSSLFQGENASGDVNQALTFQAPKQPRKNDNTQSTAGTFKLIHASTVHAYKLIEGSYANQGKLGCAILGLHENASYKFLLYKGKQVQVTSCSIVPSFKFHVQPNNYVNFYDEKNENWSLNFDNETALIEFAKQIALAKANSEGKSQSTLVIQDLTLGEGPSLETGHSAEVKYTGWLLSNYSFGQVFDSNMKSESAFRLRLGKSKVIKGWSEGLIGAQKGSRRLLIIPPNLAYGGEGMGSAVPPNSTLIFDLLVTKMKASRESSHSPVPTKLPETTDKRPEILPRSSISQEDNIRMRGASISEQLTQSPKKDKAQLISRMAKMGTATLPLQGAVPAQVSSDSENEEEPPEESPPPVQSSGSRTASPRPFSKPSSRNNSVSSAVVQPMQPSQVQESIPLQVTQHSSQISLYSQGAMPVQQPYMGQTPVFPPYQAQIQSPFHVPQPQFGMMPATSIADTHLPLLITETRSQNTEMRMSLAKITDKVDTVIQKVNDLRMNQERNSGLGHAAYMDSALLIQNIERIVQENNQLKEDVEGKNSKIQALNEKICDLLQRNQRFFEESNNMLEQRSDSIQAVSSQSQAKLLNLEKEKVKLVSDLSDATSKLSAMEAELNQLKSQESQTKQKLLEFEKAQNQANDSSIENDSLVSSLRGQVKNLNHEKEALTIKMKELEKQVQELSNSNAELFKLSEDTELRIEDYKSNEQLLMKKIKESSNENTSSEQSNIEIEMLTKQKDLILKEKDELQSQTENLKQKLKNAEDSKAAYEKKLQDMQSELEESLAWKNKYEVFYEKMHKMKTKYDSQIVQLTSKVKQLQSSVPVSSDFSGEIKKVMNVLYKLLQGQFEPATTYSGTKVLEMTLQTIRGLTFQMLQMKGRAPSNSSEGDNESRKQSISSDSDVITSGSKEPPNENNQPEDNTQDGVSSIPEVHQNGEDTLHSNSESEEVASVSEEPENINHTKVTVVKSASDSCDPKNVDSESKVEEESVSEPGSTIKDSADNSNNSPEKCTSKNTSDVIKDSKEVKQVQNDARTSPEIFWRPQPPPLFDDDDQDDDDDWLK